MFPATSILFQKLKEHSKGRNFSWDIIWSQIYSCECGNDIILFLVMCSTNKFYVAKKCIGTEADFWKVIMWYYRQRVKLFLFSFYELYQTFYKETVLECFSSSKLLNFSFDSGWRSSVTDDRFYFLFSTVKSRGK